MLQINFIPFPVLETERLVLRPLKQSDAREIFIHRQDDQVNTYLENFRFTSMEESHAFISRVQQEISDQKTILWVLTEKGRNKFIGTVCFWRISKEEATAETGYTLVSEFHNKGYMHEALAKIIAYGLETMKLKCIEAYTHQDNEASIRLLLKNKFIQQAETKKEVGKDRIFFVLNK